MTSQNRFFMDIVGTIKRNLGSRFDGDHMSFCSVLAGALARLPAWLYPRLAKAFWRAPAVSRRRETRS
jgi:hypothetical protein